jgi:hypothetical protein
MTKARSNATANAAKGDLTVGTGTNLSGILPVSSQNGDTIVADSSATTGLRYQANFAAGKNKIINGDFGVWQRGISFTTQSVYGPDRWFLTGVTSNMTFAQVTSSLPSAFQYGIKLQRNSGASNTDIFSIAQPFETSTSIPLQGQTVTLSFWAKAGANFSATSGVALIRLYSGTGTNQSAATQFGGWTGYSEWQNTGTFSPDATWTRFSVTGTVPSNATQIGLRIGWSAAGTAGADDSLQITGVQLEAANTATAFQTATGTLQGELAACQRYFNRFTPGPIALSNYYTTTRVLTPVVLPVQMRIAPTGITSNSAAFTNYVAGSGRTSSAVVFNTATSKVLELDITTAADTAGRVGSMTLDSGSFDVSAEL